LRVFLLGGVVLGGVVAYVSRDQFHYFRKFFTLASSMLILSGIGYFVLKSTFLYREVIVICIKGLALLIVTNSFSSCLSNYLNSMQIFSILLFFCICALTKEYDNLFLSLAAGFIFDLLAIVRIKFYILFRDSQKEQERNQGVSVFFIAVLALSGFLAWFLFINLPLGKIRALEKFKEEELILTDEKTGMPLPEEQIQKELTRMAFKLSSPDDMRRVLAAIQDLLIKEKPFAYEVNKAQGDIMDTLDDPALSGDPKAAELRGAVKTYAGGKISNSLMRIKNDINKAIENNRIGLGKRFVILSAANKLGYSGSLEGIDRYDEQLRNSINNADIPDEAKQELKQLNNQLREWKAYQVYSKRMESFRQKVDALGESRKDIFEDLARQVDTVNTDSDFDRAGQLIEKIRQVSLVEEDSLIEDAENMLRLKRIMLASKEISQLRERLKESGESVDKPPELEDALSAVEESRGQKEVLEKIDKLIQRLKEDNYFKIPKEAKDLLASKMEDLIARSTEVLKKEIKKSALPDSGEKLLDELKKMEDARDKEKINTSSARMREELDKLHRQGSIPEETKDKLVERVIELKDLLVTRRELKDIGKQDNSANKEKRLDQREKLDKMLKEMPLDEAQKEKMEKLLDKLKSAKTVAQVDDVLEAMTRELDQMTKKEDAEQIEKVKELAEKAAEIKKMLIQDSTLSDKEKDQLEKMMEEISSAETQKQVEEALEEIIQKLDQMTKKEDAEQIEKVKELAEKAAEEKKMFVVEEGSRDLRDKIEDLKSALPQQADLLENKLEKIRQSKTKQDLLKSAEALKQTSESKQFEKKFDINESVEVTQNKEQQDRLEIELLPAYAVLPVKSDLPLKSVAIYDGLVREISPELEWNSSNPSVAFVNQFGLVYAKAPGEAVITCRYRGAVSRKCKISVVGAITDPDGVFIKQETGI